MAPSRSKRAIPAGRRRSPGRGQCRRSPAPVWQRRSVLLGVAMHANDRGAVSREASRTVSFSNLDNSMTVLRGMMTSRASNVRFEFGFRVAQAMTIGGHHAQLLAIQYQQHAVEVITDVLTGHGELHQLQQTLEGFLRQANGFAQTGSGFDTRKIRSRQGLQGEAGLACTHDDLAVLGVELDLGCVRQGPHDIEQFASRDGDGKVFTGFCASSWVLTCNSRSVASTVSLPAFFSSSRLDRIGKV